MIKRNWIKRALQAGAVGLVGMGLASCNDNNNNSTASTVTTPTPTPVVTPLEDKFGTQFGVDYRTAANTTPVKPAAADLIALTLVAAPMALH